jgi:hypothetical protein
MPRVELAHSVICSLIETRLMNGPMRGLSHGSQESYCFEPGNLLLGLFEVIKKIAQIAAATLFSVSLAAAQTNSSPDSTAGGAQGTTKPPKWPGLR